MKKKLLLSFLALVGLILMVLLLLPFLFKDKIAQAIKTAANDNLEATLDFKELDLSLFKDFPDAHIDITQLSLANKAPFVGDTLFKTKHLAVTLSLKSIFKAPEGPFELKKIQLDEPNVFIKVDEQGLANYDIAKPNEISKNTSEDSADSNVQLILTEYQINAGHFTYLDAGSGINLSIDALNHRGEGDLSAKLSELKTKSNARVSFAYEGSEYITNQNVVLDAIIKMDLDKLKFTFLDNEALINRLPLKFDGFVQLQDQGQLIDIRFETPNSDFKNFLGLIPERYTKDISAVKTTGSFGVKGKLEGLSTEERIPNFSIDMVAQDASFQYPDLPQKINDIQIDAHVVNTTGLTEDTQIDINKFAFVLGGDAFEAAAQLREIMGNPRVSAKLAGKINLGNLKKAYPMPEDLDLSGLLNANISTSFDMASIEAKEYEKTKTEGSFSLSNFNYNSAELTAPLLVHQMNLTFNPKTVALNQFDGKLGKSDLGIKGQITNLLGYLFKDEDLKGNFSLQSQKLYIDDFLIPLEENPSQDNKAAETQSQEIKIPSFLDVSFQAIAEEVYYDNLVLKAVGGNLTIKEQIATLSGVTADIFGGKIQVDGNVNTQNPIATFNLGLQLKEIQIAETFKQLNLFKILAPIANALQGALNTQLNFEGNLKEDFTPNLATISGGVLAELLQAKLTTSASPLLSSFENELAFIDLNQLNLNNQKAALNFEEGSVTSKPLSFNYKDIPISLSGNHSFDQDLNYKLELQVPTKYLGKEVNELIAKIGEPSLSNTPIPVNVNIGGKYTAPMLKTDLKQGIKTLTNNLIAYQKQKLLDKGKSKASEFINDVFNKELDSTQRSNNGPKSVIKDFLGAGTKDSVKANQPTQKAEEKVKNILGGLLGGKKKDTTKQKN